MKYQGYIDSIDDENKTFCVILQLGESKAYTNTRFDEVPEEDRCLITVGQLLELELTDKFKITFSKLPEWTEEEMKQIKERAERLFKKLKFI